MRYHFVPSNMNSGAGSCTIRVFSDQVLQSVQWCREDEYPEGLKNAESQKIKVTKNGRYCVRLKSREETAETTFTVCHLKPFLGFDGGDGSAEHPYLISNCAQLNGIRQNMSAHYRLTADLDLAAEMEGLSWVPIGRYSCKEQEIDPDIPLEDQWEKLSYLIDFGFMGELDGGGHEISGLSVYQPKPVELGLFGSAGATAVIHDLCLRNCVIQGEEVNLSVGGLLGICEGATVENCLVEGEIFGPIICGGLIGFAERALVRSCQFVAGITGGDASAGGILGDGRLSSGSPFVNRIQDCCVLADIRCQAHRSGSAGIAARCAWIDRCLYRGTINTGMSAAGILVRGQLGRVRSSVCAAGFISVLEDRPAVYQHDAYVTFLTEEGEDTGDNYSYIKNCWASCVGRIQNYDYKLSPHASENTNLSLGTCTLSSGSGAVQIVEGSLRDGTSVSEEQLHDVELYQALGWDFERTWEMGENGWPRLRFKK